MSRYRRSHGGSFYGRFHKRNWGSNQVYEHMSERRQLSSQFGGIDKDVEKLFLNLSNSKLEAVLVLYGGKYGASALSYARDTYHRWKSGAVKMSGTVAERLLNLVPLVLDSSTRFDLVKKLRAAYLHKEHRWVTCEPADWRGKVAPVVAELLNKSHSFRLPEDAINRVKWLAEGDATAAQKLLAAAEQEEAAVRLAYLEAEFRRIDYLLQNIEATKTVSHTIELPQGTIQVSIAMPRKGFWRWLGDLLS